MATQIMDEQSQNQPINPNPVNNINNNRSRLFLLYGGIGVFFIFVITTVIIFSASSKKKITPSISPTPIPIVTQVPRNPNFTPPPTYPPVTPSDTSHKQLSVTTTSPTNNQQDVPLTLGAISITFDQPVSVSDVPLAISPSIEYGIASQGNQLIITPKQQLLPGIAYSIVLRLYTTGGQISLYTLTFRTVGATPTPMPTDSFNNQQESDQQRQAAPDVYLSNYTPHTGPDYSVTSNYNLNLHRFQFIVQLSGSDRNLATNDFTSWLKTLGFTEQEIQQLDISYQ